MSSQINTTAKQRATETALVALGSNLASQFGSSEATLRAAIERLAGLSRTPPLASSLYSTEAVGCPPGAPNFVNAVVVLEIAPGLPAQDLLNELQQIEAEFGRQREGLQNQARGLDLDLISYGDQIVNEEFLILPHPRAERRRFVLQPIAEIAPGFVLPGQSLSVEQLLARLADSEAPLRSIE